TRKVIMDPRMLTARGAGVLGMMKFGAKATFALDPDLNVVEADVLSFVERHGRQPFLIFGFTFLVWLKLFKTFEHRGLDLSNAIIIHSGGWKKMEEMREVIRLARKAVLKIEARIEDEIGVVIHVHDRWRVGDANVASRLLA